MRKIRFLLVIVIISFAEALVASNQATKYLTKRTVEIEWDVVPGATQYELEIYDGKNRKFIKTFSSKTNVFKLNVKMGKYYFRSRIFDRFERSSEWTDLAELLIAPPPTRILSKLPSDSLIFAGKKTGIFEHTLTWEALPGVNDYKVIVENPDGKLVNEFSIKGTSAKLKVPPGQFQFRIQAVLPDGTVGDPSEPTPVLSILGAKIRAPVISFGKHSRGGRSAFVRSELASSLFDGELFYKTLEGNDWFKVKNFYDLKDHAILFDSTYKPGLYRLKLQAKARGFTPSEYGYSEFVIKPTEGDLLPIPDESIAARQGRQINLPKSK
jgi:hypothetical protein